MKNRGSHVTIRIMGGLGNQLFQYALGRSLEINCGAEIFFNTTSIDLKSGRKFMLDQFNTRMNIGPWDVEKGFLNQFINIIKGTFYIKENRMQFIPSLFCKIKNGGNFYLEGYWQTEKYFQSIREQLLTEITLKDQYSEKARAISDSIFSTTSVSLHLRRGDYITNPNYNKIHGVCSIEYYQEAIKRIEQKIPNPYFFVFSDDIEWVKENLTHTMKNVTFVSGRNFRDEEELLLMSECKHNIIANSSFSWWAAWLNKNNDKIVIAPKEWFKVSFSGIKDIIPISWTQI